MTTKLFKKTSTSGFEYYASRRIGPSQSAMAAGFVGLTIVVTLKSPANTVLQGLVADVHEQSSTLLLQNGQFNSIFCTKSMLLLVQLARSAPGSICLRLF